MRTLNRIEAAKLLNMHPITLLQKVHAGLIPAAKPAKSWVFIQDDLIQYLRGIYQNNKLPTYESYLKPISEPLKHFKSKSAYYKLLGIDDCPQILSPQPDRVVAQATQTKRIRSRSEAVGLVVNSATMAQSNCG